MIIELFTLCFSYFLFFKFAFPKIIAMIKQEHMMEIIKKAKMSKQLNLKKKEFDQINLYYLQALERKVNWVEDADKEFDKKAAELNLLFQKKIAVLKSKHETLKNLSIQQGYKKAQNSIFEEYKNYLKDVDLNKSIYF